MRENCVDELYERYQPKWPVLGLALGATAAAPTDLINDFPQNDQTKS